MKHELLKYGCLDPSDMLLINDRRVTDPQERIGVKNSLQIPQTLARVIAVALGMNDHIVAEAFYENNVFNINKKLLLFELALNVTNSGILSNSLLIGSSGSSISFSFMLHLTFFSLKSSSISSYIYNLTKEQF